MLRRQQLSVFINVARIDSDLAQTSLSQLPWPLTRLIIAILDERFAIIKKKDLRLLRAAQRRISHFTVSLLFYSCYGE